MGCGAAHLIRLLLSTHTHTEHSAPERRDRVCAERARIKSSLDLCSYYTFKKATDVVFGASHSDRLLPTGLNLFQDAALSRFNSGRRCLIITIIAAPDQDKTRIVRRLNMMHGWLDGWMSNLGDNKKRTDSER
jgi:hypothetical protein